jgi:MFS family permease
MSSEFNDEPPPLSGHDPYAALRIPSYRRYLTGHFLALLGMQMQATAVGWEVYLRTQSTAQLGLVAFLQFIPVLILGIPAGQLADRFPRKLILSIGLMCLALGSLGLTWISWTQAPIEWMYLFLLMNGAAKAITQPAKGAMLPLLVPKDRFTSAVTWNSSTFELATVLGPGIAGLLLAQWKLPALIYLLEASSSVVFLILLLAVKMRPQAIARRAASWGDLLDGVRFVWNQKIILGTISLDLFAVLLGGAISLLPVYATSILDVGPEGQGLMRAMPALGAVCTAIAVAHLPPFSRAGRTMLWSVAGFGIATIIFGFSRNFALSLFMLFLTGVFDNVSVQVRQTLVQLLTPDEMRGRVAAVNGIFIGASNELGGAESGLVASLFQRENDIGFGPTVSVVSGGFGTLMVVAIIAKWFPGVRNYGRLDSGHQPPEQKPETQVS